MRSKRGQDLGTAVGLAGVEARVFDSGDSFDDCDIDAEIIKQSLAGELTSGGLDALPTTGN